MSKRIKSKDSVCEVLCINKKKVAGVRKIMKPDGTIIKLTQTFSALGDPTRIRIIFALSKEELCVCDIAQLLGMSHSAISHQLRVLRNMDLVKFRKAGKVVYYYLDDNHIRNLFEESLEHIEEEQGQLI
ncbi:MAG: ArsR/SmtB family transcription factor [Candidatus Omnitrophota bacterium]